MQKRRMSMANKRNKRRNALKTPQPHVIQKEDLQKEDENSNSNDESY